MIDLYLKFESEAQLLSVLFEEAEPMLNEEGDRLNAQYRQRYANIDNIGVIYEPASDPEASPVPIEGWHANVRVVPGEDETPLLPYSVTPSQPRRVWA